MWSLQLCLFGIASLASALPRPLDSYAQHKVLPPYHDYIPNQSKSTAPRDDGTFKYKWLSISGEILDDVADESQYVEISSTLAINDHYEATGCDTVTKVMANSPAQVFIELALRGSVGLFTKEDKTTIFPEYEHLRDRPECEGTCAGACSDTCTGDGRKYDDLAGLGGIRATCVDDNYMCTPDDPYAGTDNILVHEFAHTIHGYSLPYVDDWWDRIWYAWRNAVDNEIWELGSYAMSNHMEYFAEGAGVFFNVNHHFSSTGGMNSCGKPVGYCETEEEARQWLEQQDPQLYEALSFTFTNYNDHLDSGLSICPE